MQSYENEAKLARQALKDTRAYVTTLETELDKVHASVRKLASSVPNIDMLLPLTPIEQVKKLRQRAGAEVARDIAK